MSATLMYFAYGSNMFTPRLRYRVRNCGQGARASLPSHRLCFHKQSKDGSAKCNALFTGERDAVVHGVLFVAPEAELDHLHEAEGRGAGYEDKRVRVTTRDGSVVEALTYLASPTHIDDTLQPYSWYRDLVMSGAHEHQLPGDYIDRFINAVAAMPDPDARRDADERAKIRE